MQSGQRNCAPVRTTEDASSPAHDIAKLLASAVRLPRRCRGRCRLRRSRDRRRPRTAPPCRRTSGPVSALSEPRDSSGTRARSSPRSCSEPCVYLPSSPPMVLVVSSAADRAAGSSRPRAYPIPVAERACQLDTRHTRHGVPPSSPGGHAPEGFAVVIQSTDDVVKVGRCGRIAARRHTVDRAAQAPSSASRCCSAGACSSIRPAHNRARRTSSAIDRPSATSNALRDGPSSGW